MVFVETPHFSKWSDEFLDDDAFSALLRTLESNPSAGTALGHGLRKLRVGLPGRGKRGGARVIYFHVSSDDQVYLLYGYAKNEQANLTKAQLSYLAALMREELDG
jgi:hypothetical protein